MEFDLSTATLDIEATNQLEEENKFDVSSAEIDIEATNNLNSEEQNEMLYGKIGKPTYMSAYKAPNVIDGLKNAWDFVTQVPYAAFMEQKKDNEAAELRTKGMMLRRIGQDLSEEEKARIQELDNPYSLGKYNEANNYGIYSKFHLDSNGEYFEKGSPVVIPERVGNGIKNLYAEVSKQTAIMYSIAKDAGIAATLGGLAGMGIGAITGAISTKTPQGALAGARTGFGGGAKLLARTAVAKKSFELEAGFMRQELEALNNDFIANGTEPLTDREMDDLATAVGMINASLEYVGLGAVLKSIPNGQKVLDMFGKEGVKDLAKDATFRQRFKAVATDLAKISISEGSTEMLQETTNFVYGNIARKMRNVAPRPLADKIDEIIQAGLVGAISAIILGGVGTTAQVAKVKIKQGLKPEVAKQEAEAMTLDERNEFINENIETLAEAANEEADNILKGGVTYNRYKNELIKQGADEQQADNSAQLIEQAYRVIADKFGNEGIEHLKNANLQVIINNNNAKQIQAEEEILDTIMSEEEKSDKLMQFSVDELKTDAKTFQYKGNSNDEGVLNENGLEDVEKWDNKVSGKVFVYENKKGERFIADGHQRLALAKRLGDPNIKLDGYLFREADGFTPAQVRTLAAYKNIGEKSGTALDAAKIIKEVGLEKLPKTIPMKSTLFKDGVSLSRLGDVAFEKVVNEEIPMNYAARVADAIKEDESKQAAAIDLIRKYYVEGKVPNAERAYNIASDINSAPTNVVEQINLFGTQEITQLLYVEKAEIVDRAVKDLQTNKKLFLKASKNKGKLESKGKTKIDKAASEMTAREAAIAAEIIQHRAYVAGDISEKANELAQKVKDGEIKVSEAVKEFEDFVLTPKILKEITGYTRKSIKYNQAAIDKAENISDLLSEDVAGTITPLEFYQKGFYQVAYKGSMSNHDIESTNFIGSGEGSLAHGWGLYYAEDKKVAQNYFDTLNSVDYYYNGARLFGFDHVLYKNIDQVGAEKLLKEYKEQLKDEEELKKEADKVDFLKEAGLPISNFNEIRINELKRKIKIIENFDEKKLEKRGGKGQLYKVDIPENDVLLDEQELLDDQPKKVQESIQKLYEDEEWLQTVLESNIEYNATGRELYNALAEEYGKEEASKLLNKYGIKGITYDGRQDGRCYVIFDDKAINILDRYYQNNNGQNDAYKSMANEVIEAIKNNKLPSADEAYKYSDNGFSFLRAKIEDAREMFTRYDNAVKAAEAEYKAKIEKAKTQETKNKYKKQYEAKLAKAEKMLANTKAMLTSQIDNAINETENQEGEQAPRGQFRIDENGSAIIDILQNGDASTIVHELGHFYLYSVEQLAQKNKRAEKEFNDILEHYGFTAEDLKDYDKLTDLHEKFARGFEAYLLEGSAPTKKMLKVFKNFKLWLRDIYNSVKDLDVDFSEASQKLFDRIFTTDEEYEKEVLPKYQYNYKKVLEIEQAQNEPEYKIKEALNNSKNFISTWYDKIYLPLDTRLGKLAPELKQKLRKHTAALAAITGKDLKVATTFFNATNEIKKKSPEDYYKLDLALKNRDSLTVNMVCEKYNLKKDFEAVRDILDDIYTEALEVGLDVGYLENYYPRQVKRNLTDKFIEYIEALERKEQLDIANQVLKFEDAKISLVLREMKEANNSQFWTQEDKAKFLNNRIRGFGQNNILLGRNGSLKYDRSIDELDGNFNQFYEPMEVALVNYISSSRKTIEARKFFGGEDREVGKLRARIKRKKATLAEVQDRTPYQAKLKEENRIKYELSPLEIKLEALEKQDYIDNTEYKEKVQKKVDRLKSQLEWTEKANPFQVKGVVIKRLKDEIYEAAKQIKDIIGDEEHIEDSIGQLVAKLAQNGDIIAKDEREIREMLVARFSVRKISDPARILRDTTYIATLNDITNAITQFGDLAFSVYKFGFENTYKGLMKPFEIRKEDLGLNDLAYEFANPTLLAKWIKKQFDLIGLSKIDGLGKNTYIQASILDAQKQIKKNNTVFDNKLKALFGDNIEEVKKDLLEGKTTDNTIIFTFNELADIQPISEDQTPELYNNGSDFMRLFYTLKTYGIKALDVARNDITMKIEEGIKTKNKKLAKEGLKNLVRLQMLLWLFGVPIDGLKDLLANRDFNLFETVIDNLIPAFLINRYMVRIAGREGVGSAVVSFFPPACVSVAKNILNFNKYTITNIPFIGKPLYNWGIKEK